MNQYKVDEIIPGDIILVSSPTKQSKFIRDIQSVVVFNEVEFSHVMMIHSPMQIVIHSDRNGVHLSPLADIMNSEVYNQEWKVMRHKKIEEEYLINGNNFLESIYENSTKNIGDNYNFAFGFDNRGASFCSELVVKILNELGVIKFEKLPHKTFPAHLELLLKNKSEWLDVSEVYKKKVDFMPSEVKSLIKEFAIEEGFSPEEIHVFLEEDPSRDVADILNNFHRHINGKSKKDPKKTK